MMGGAAFVVLVSLSLLRQVYSGEQSWRFRAHLLSPVALGLWCVVERQPHGRNTHGPIMTRKQKEVERGQHTVSTAPSSDSLGASL